MNNAIMVGRGLRIPTAESIRRLLLVFDLPSNEVEIQEALEGLLYLSTREAT
jgi:hypothetical protein